MLEVGVAVKMAEQRTGCKLAVSSEVSMCKSQESPPHPEADVKDALSEPVMTWQRHQQVMGCELPAP